VDIRVAADPASAAVVAAETIARRVRAIAPRRRVSIAVSGGSTPALMFAALAEMALPWAQIDFFQVDERVAPDGDAARNIALLDVLPVKRSQICPMPVTSADLVRASQRYAARLPHRFDVVHLGLGDDGHTASWPPGDAVIRATGDVAISGSYRGHVRMTLTPSAVNRAGGRVVLAAGAEKASVVARWMLHDASLPIQVLRRTGTTLVLDEAAARGLHPVPVDERPPIGRRSVE
jgi:6-phosphogluconolactonase/glucosamine-6-phosphate isomerase/deaminase